MEQFLIANIAPIMFGALVIFLLRAQIARWYDTDNALMLAAFMAAVFWLGWRWTEPDDKAKIMAGIRRDAGRLRRWWRHFRSRGADE